MSTLCSPPMPRLSMQMQDLLRKTLHKFMDRA